MLMRRENAPARSPTSFSNRGGVWKVSAARISRRWRGLGRRRRGYSSWQRLRIASFQGEELMRTLAFALTLLTAAACTTYTPTTTDTGPYGSTTADTAYVPGTLVRCESINNGRQTCRVNAGERMVSINQQLSDNPCILGRSWGVSSNRDEIWVDNGCRAEFQVGGAPVATGAFGRAVVCESQNNGKSRCPVDTSYGVQLARQISKNECVRGDDWGFDENGIWVDHGCRAEFVLGGEDRFLPMPTTTARARVTCESQNET